MPAPLPPWDVPNPALGRSVRLCLVGLALGLVAVFAVAVWLKPYDDDGQPRQMETHRQLGLPPCTFYLTTGMPCPSCGMTTSFALLAHGDVENSLRANAVGTLLAVYCLALIPWAVVSAARARPLFARSLERVVTGTILVFLVLLLVRWAVVVGLAWAGGKGFHWRFPPVLVNERALTEETRWHFGTPGAWHSSSLLPLPASAATCSPCRFS